MQNKTNNTKTKTTFKDKNQLNDNKHKIGQLSTSALDLLNVFYDTRSDNKVLKHSTHTLKITKTSSTNINTIKQSTKHKQQTSPSKRHMKKVNERIKPTTDDYTFLVPVTENQKNARLD